MQKNHKPSSRETAEQRKKQRDARETAEQRKKQRDARETAEQRKKQRDARAARARRKTASRKAKRRQPYDDGTRLVDLVRPAHYLRLRQLMDELQPVLADSTKASATYLKFDFGEGKGPQKLVYVALARFLFADREKRVLKVSLAAFARYLTDPVHSNLSLSHNTLTDKLQKVRRTLDLT